MTDSKAATLNIDPPFRADHVGSLLRPASLLDARYAEPGKRPSLEVLKELEDQAIREAVALQESLGLQSITDGEFRRESYRSGFVGKVEGFERRPQRFAVGMARDASGKATALGDPPFAARRLRRVREIATDEFTFLKAITKRTPKITLPAPSYMHFFLGNESFDHAVYSGADEYFADLVDIYIAEMEALARGGCRYVQIDETVLPSLCDPNIREGVTARGEDPDALVDLYLDVINRIARRKPEGMSLAMHFCRGNSMGRWLAEGGYDYISEKVFALAEVDSLFLEYDSPRAGSFDPLQHVAPAKTVVLGLVSTKSPEIESSDDLKRRIDEAAKYVPIERLCLSPQCGFASRDKGNPITLDVEKRKLELVVKVAGDVWS